MSTKIKPAFRQEILNSVLSRTPPALLYHYTDQSGFLGIVKHKGIWASHHQCLNDTQEFLHAKDFIRGEIDKRYVAANSDRRSLLDVMRSTLDGPGNEVVNLYVASFSEDGDSLAQWRAYSGQTAGFALGFRGDQLVLPEEFTIVRCIYKPDEQCEVANGIVAEVENALAQMAPVGPRNAKITAQTTLLLTLHRLALVFKHKKFEAEKEWRIISSHPLMDFKPAFPVGGLESKLYFRPGKSMLIPYRCIPLNDDKNNFPLHEVVVGPNPNKEQSKRSVQSLLNSQGLMAVADKVRSSDVTYRNW
jgi:hypothetical protein